MGSIHRGSEVARLEAAILDAAAGVSVVSVSGTGGVGKSYLVQHVLDALKVDHPGVLLLKVDGSDPERRADFMGLLEQLAPRRMPPPQTPPKRAEATWSRATDSCARLLFQAGGYDRTRMCT